MRLPPLLPPVRTTALGAAVVAVCAMTAFAQAPAPGAAPPRAAASASQPPVLDREQKQAVSEFAEAMNDHNPRERLLREASASSGKVRS